MGIASGIELGGDGGGGSGGPTTASNVSTEDGSTVQAKIDQFNAQFNGADLAFTAIETKTNRIILSGTKVVLAAAGESGLRAALNEAFSYLALPAATVVLSIPAQPDLQLQDVIVIDTVSAQRVFIKGPDPTAQPAPTALTTAVAAGNDPAGQPLYDVTFTLAGNHSLAVGQSVWLTARSTIGAPANMYQALGGFHRVSAVPAANQVTLRIPSWLSLTGLVGLPVAGQANSVAFTLERSNFNLRTPTNNPGTTATMDIFSSKLLGIGNIGFVGGGGVFTVAENRHLNIRGASTLIETTGKLGFRGGGAQLCIDDGAIARFGGAPGDLGVDPVIACNGGSNHGVFVGPGAFATFRGASAIHLSGNGGTSAGGQGVTVIGAQCDIISATAIPMPGTFGGNYDQGAAIVRQSRATLRFPALYLPIYGNLRNATQAQVYAEGISHVDMGAMSASIPVSPGANATGNNSALILR